MKVILAFFILFFYSVSYGQEIPRYREPLKEPKDTIVFSEKKWTCSDFEGKGLVIDDWDDVPKNYSGLTIFCYGNQLASISNWVDGKEKGYKYAFLDGKVTDRTPVGVRGIEYQLYDGLLELESEWSNEGEPDGYYRDYHPNGVLQTEGEYKEGIRTGVWKHYDENGKLIKTELEFPEFNENQSEVQDKDKTALNWTWMNANLTVKEFRNGDKIQQAKTKEEWIKACSEKKPVWCYYDNNSANANNGVLYNWYAIADERGIAPEGYHIPTDAEWIEWNNYPRQGTEWQWDKIVKPGARLPEGDFKGKDTDVLLWGLDKEASREQGVYCSGNGYGNWFGDAVSKCWGLPVRCVKD